MAKTNDVETFDLSKFFSKDNEEKGKWFNLEIDGKSSGIKAKLYGPNSSAVTIADDEFKKQREEIELIKDVEEKEEAMQKALAKRIAGYTIDLASISGKELTVRGKPFTKDDIYTFYLNSPVLALEALRKASNQVNFLD